MADPQIQGDERVSEQGLYGELDLLLNDLYFTHIMDNAYRFIRPDLVFVLGDLISRHQVSSREFSLRAARLHAIFERDGLTSVDRPLQSTSLHSQDPSLSIPTDTLPSFSINLLSEINDVKSLSSSSRSNSETYKTRLVYLVGNHDVGYGGEMQVDRMREWEAQFGSSNRLLRSRTGHWMAVLNSQTLDSPREESMREATLEHIRAMQEQVARAGGGPLVLAKHIPLHKEAGFCADAPLVQTRRLGTLVTKQNFMTPNSTQLLLEALRPVLVFNGHDHEGCHYVHTDEAHRHIPEYTVRSVMGDYGGHVMVVDVHRNDAAEGPEFVYRVMDVPFISIRVIVVLLVVWMLLVVLAILIFIKYPHLSNLHPIELKKDY